MSSSEVVPSVQRRVCSDTAIRNGHYHQPVGHFWTFQWIEGGWLVALSTLLVVVTVSLVRRRAA